MNAKRSSLKQRIRAFRARRRQRRLKQQEIEKRRLRQSDAELLIFPFGSTTYEADLK